MNSLSNYLEPQDYQEPPALVLNETNARAILEAHNEGRGIGDDLLQRVKDYLAARNESNFVRFSTAEIKGV